MKITAVAGCVFLLVFPQRASIGWHCLCGFLIWLFLFLCFSFFLSFYILLIFVSVTILSRYAVVCSLLYFPVCCWLFWGAGVVAVACCCSTVRSYYVVIACGNQVIKKIFFGLSFFLHPFCLNFSCSSSYCLSGINEIVLTYSCNKYKFDFIFILRWLYKPPPAAAAVTLTLLFGNYILKYNDTFVYGRIMIN